PFDVILVSAGGPEPPGALLEQLAAGGRLVMPVGENVESQRLTLFTRRVEGGFDTDAIAAVRFVPLIGEQGWSEDGRRSASNHVPGRADGHTLPQMIARAAEPLPDLDDREFAAAFDRYADRRVVLLGESSHGTSEFYRARAAITRRLVERHGFTIIAVEADWPDAASIDRYVRQRRPGPAPERRQRAFERFPTWMWRNEEVAAFVEWLRERNASVPESSRRAGFFGLDLYNMRGSIAAVIEYLEGIDPEAARIARERYGCLTPWQKDPATYGRAVLSERYRSCEEAVAAQCRSLLQKQLAYARSDGDDFLDAAQNARLVASAERYYRVMYYGGAESWNLRDTHMFQTLEHLLDAGGPSAKAVVWAHNSHIGDARFTEMGTMRNELNIGQLCRENFAEDAALIGFGTSAGTVAAATDWNGALEFMRVRPALKDSIEALCHEAGLPRFLLDLSPKRDPALRRRLLDPRPERFIGVIYRPDTERLSHYADVSLPQQFDAFVWFDQTKAVTPLGDEPARADVPETWPFVL
ncbi:MAG: erythromycin esterase family protein, partial [Panacagrimonas sp.]